MNVEVHADWIGPIMTALGSLLGGGGLLSYVLARRRDRQHMAVAERAEDRSDFKLLLEELKYDRDRLKEELDKARLEIQLLSLRVTMLEGKSTQTPYPEWMIDGSGRYIWCNTAFESYFLLQNGRSMVWLNGKRHEDVWTKDVAAELHAIDMDTQNSMSRTKAKRVVLVDDAPFMVVKWAAFDHITEARVGFHGSAIPLED